MCTRQISQSSTRRLLAGAPGTGELTVIPSGSQPLRSLRRATWAVPKSPSGAPAFGTPIVSTDVEVTTVSTRDGQPFGHRLGVAGPVSAAICTSFRGSALAVRAKSP